MEAQTDFKTIIQEFYASMEAINAKLRQEIFINETVRKENFATYEEVAGKIQATLSAVTDIDAWHGGASPSPLGRG